MSCHRRRDPAFPFVEAELAVRSSSAKGSACSALAGHQKLLTEEINAQPWRPSTWAVGSNCSIVRREGFDSLQQSFNMSRAKCQNLHPNANRLQHIQSIPSSEAYNWSRSSSSTDVKSFGAYLPPCNAHNAGSLVLDTSIGELVNALETSTPKEILEAKAVAAARSHSEAERRRRERINSHLATLRTILPSSVKSDKAALLAEVIDQVKKLKREVSDVYCYGSLPSETDELLVETDPISEAAGMVKIRVSMSCDDRPDLMTDLKQAIDTLQLHTVKVEMSTLGCRMKNDLLVATRDGYADHNVDALIKRLQEALRLVMERPERGELLQGNYIKRQQLMIADAQAADF